MAAKRVQNGCNRQVMESHQYEAYHYRDSYLNEVALHHHDFYEVYVFLQGKAIYSVENRTYHLMPGDVLIISPLELHQLRVTDERAPYERLVLWIDRTYLENLSSEQTSLTRCFDTGLPQHTNLLRLSPAARGSLADLIEKLIELQAVDRYGNDLLGACYLTELLVELNRSVTDPTTQRPGYQSDRTVDKVLQYLNTHYSENISLDFLAKQFNISKYHLLRKFDEQIGTGVHRYLRQHRLLIAKQLLADGVSPNETYLHCGFGDYTCFFRAFKAEYGISPREFSKGVRHDAVTESAQPIENGRECKKELEES